MARRRFQQPKPFIKGNFWYIRPWIDTVENGERRRRKKLIRLASKQTAARMVKSLAEESMRPANQGLITAGGAVTFSDFIKTVYRPTKLDAMSATTQERSNGVLKNYLLPKFGTTCLRDITKVEVQKYFTGMAGWALAHESKDKIKDVLASALSTAVEYEYLVKNPVEGVTLPRPRTGRKKDKPWITQSQFDQLLELIAEPYATMIFVAVYTGLRVSELIALRWRNIVRDTAGNWTLVIEERCCRGDWGAPKSLSSNSEIALLYPVVSRIERLKTMTVKVRAGRGTRTYMAVKGSGPDDLIFQSVRKGAAMRDNNILCRHIKPAGRKLGIGWIGWHVLRRSHATWLDQRGASLKDIQAQMRHSRASTTADIYIQRVPDSQRQAVERLWTVQ